MPSMSAPLPNAVASSPPGPRYQPLVVVLTAAVAGILLDRFWPLPLGAWWALAVGGLAIWLLARISHHTGKLADSVPLLACPAVPSVTGCPALLDKPAVAHRGEKCGLVA